jgi:hypothetical protein
MTLIALLAYGALGSALAWLCIAWLRHSYKRHRRLHCITPYVPADQRSAPPVPHP